MIHNNCSRNNNRGRYYFVRFLKWGSLFGMLLLMAGCAALNLNGKFSRPAKHPARQVSANKSDNSTQQSASNTKAGFPFAQFSKFTPSGQTGVNWKPAYEVKDVQLGGGVNGLPKLRVGADINTKNGPVPLYQIVNALASLKGMSVSWASDVNRKALVDVNIKANDDFWSALDNILRQLDYYYDYNNNTIIIGYKDTRRFYVPMPFLSTSYSGDVGGDLLGGDKNNSGVMKGNLSLKYQSSKIDIWTTIKKNLDEILSRGVTQVSGSSTNSASKKGTKKSKSGNKSGQNTNNSKRFFYTIDRPLGIITVTAPRSILSQVATYIKNLKKQLYKEVTIEAKIIEVQLNRDSQTGIDWSSLLSNSGFSGNVYFGISDNDTANSGTVYPTKGVKFISKITLNTKSFQLFLNALKAYGHVKILSNPKLTLMNGQPAMLTVGESVRYIDKVTSNVDSEHGIVTYNVETNSVLSGLGLGVVASIGSNGEVVLQLTPVTSKLEEPIEYKDFGNNDKVGLPRIFLREMTTIARVKSGQVLVIGGLIDDQTGNDQNKVPLLGDIPVLGYLFKHVHKYTNKRELIILLRPQIVSM